MPLPLPLSPFVTIRYQCRMCVLPRRRGSSVGVRVDGGSARSRQRASARPTLLTDGRLSRPQRPPRAHLGLSAALITKQAAGILPRNSSGQISPAARDWLLPVVRPLRPARFRFARSDISRISHPLALLPSPPPLALCTPRSASLTLFQACRPFVLNNLLRPAFSLLPLCPRALASIPRCALPCA